MKKILVDILMKMFTKQRMIVCSRNMVNNNKNSLYWRIAKKYNLEQILKENPTLTIQGEQGDLKVQGNKYKITEDTMWVFNIIDHKDPHNKYHFNYAMMFEFCDRYNLDIVPLIEVNWLSNIGKTVEEIVEYSNDKSKLAKIPREGVVIRCIEDGKRIFSFKAINPKFLLKYD